MNKSINKHIYIYIYNVCGPGDGKDTYTRYDADGNLQDIVKAAR